MLNAGKADRHLLLTAAESSTCGVRCHATAFAPDEAGALLAVQAAIARLLTNVIHHGTEVLQVLLPAVGAAQELQYC